LPLHVTADRFPTKSRHFVIDPDVGFEMQCFLLLHLFGHSVQWVAPSLEQKLTDLQHTQDRGCQVLE
jgi:hypothetical protein